MVQFSEVGQRYFLQQWHSNSDIAFACNTLSNSKSFVLAWVQSQWNDINFVVFEYDFASVVASIFSFNISDDHWPILHELKSAFLPKFYCLISIVQANASQQFVSVPLFPFDWADVCVRLHIRQMEDELLAFQHRLINEDLTLQKKEAYILFSSWSCRDKIPWFRMMFRWQCPLDCLVCLIVLFSHVKHVFQKNTFRRHIHECKLQHMYYYEPTIIITIKFKGSILLSALKHETSPGLPSIRRKRLKMMMTVYLWVFIVV